MIGFEGNSPLWVWRNACDHIANVDSEFSVVLTINRPNHFSDSWTSQYCPKQCSGQGQSLDLVIKTIFPYNLLDSYSTRSSLYSKYLALIDRSSHGKWGTYFERMIRFGPSKANQLEKIVLGILNSDKQWKARFNIHITTCDYDGDRVFGMPCLQYVQFGMFNGRVELTAVYRNHDYFFKALGNILGLCFLLKFVCKETGLPAGALRVHSLHAYNHSSKANMKRLTKGLWTT